MWVDVYGRQAQWNGTAWELVKGQGDFDKPDSGDKPQKGVFYRHNEISGVKARERLEEMDPNDPVVGAYSELTDDQLGLVRMYTMSYYRDFNNYLRGRENKNQNEGEKESIRRGATDMIEVMENIPNSPESSYYRGVSSDPETSLTAQQYLELEPGDILSDRGFGSYTSSKRVTEDFMTYGGRNQNFLIINKSGRLKNVEPVTANPEEFEHISMPGAEFRVRKNEIVEDRKFGKIRVIEIEDY
jgi:hypothetical protein